MTQPLFGQADWARGGPGPRVAHSQAGKGLMMLPSLKSSVVLFWELQLRSIEKIKQRRVI